jgi:hypothetical protein
VTRLLTGKIGATRVLTNATYRAAPASGRAAECRLNRHAARCPSFAAAG